MVTILSYHGVIDVASVGIENFQGKHMAADRFRREMCHLREHETLLTLGQVVESYARGRELDGVVVTFDDGYRNNLTVALPILAELEVPATFFFSTGFIGTERMFWVDEVEWRIDQTEVEAVDLSDCGLWWFPLVSDDEKIRAVTEIKAFLKGVDDHVKENILGELKKRVPLRPGARLSPGYETLSWSEVKTLSRSPLVEIGAHSVDHTILSRIDGDRLRYQVSASKRDLEWHLDREVTLFAYPNGGPGDYNGEVVEAVRAAGFRCGCTTLPGPNTAVTDLFELRRSMVGFCGEPFPFPAVARGV